MMAPANPGEIPSFTLDNSREFFTSDLFQTAPAREEPDLPVLA